MQSQQIQYQTKAFSSNNESGLVVAPEVFHKKLKKDKPNEPYDDEADACPGVKRPNFRSDPDPNSEDCKTYRTELVCFRNNIARCDTLSNNAHKQQCRNFIQNTWIADRVNRVANRC